MDLSSLFKRKPSGERDAAASTAQTSADGVQRVRTRTRQRLIGAVVLVSVGVIGFPLLFESQPRPVPVDIPIEIPARDTTAALVMPAPRKPAPAAATASSAGSVPTIPAAASEAPVPAPVAAASVASASLPAQVASAQPAARATVASAPAVAERAVASAAKAGSEAAAADAVRFVVQVGAFADPASARDVRLKLEKLGIKTFAQTVETDGGKRTRVRVGPFANRAEADKMAARVRDAGLSPAVLKL